jgi:uncharacterized protein (UPF0335 family)
MRHVDASRLRAIVGRVAEVHAARAALGEDLKAIWGEARSDGFDVRALKEAVRRLGRDGRQAFEDVVACYLDAIEGRGGGAQSGPETGSPETGAPESGAPETGTDVATRAGAREAAREQAAEAVGSERCAAAAADGVAMPPIPDFLQRGAA